MSNTTFLMILHAGTGNKSYRGSLTQILHDPAQIKLFLWTYTLHPVYNYILEVKSHETVISLSLQLDASLASRTRLFTSPSTTLQSNI